MCGYVSVGAQLQLVVGARLPFQPFAEALLECFREPAHARMATLIDAVAEALLAYLDRPFAVFGHSMGALVGYELLRDLRRRRGVTAACLFASGCRAPHVPSARPPPLSF